MLACGICDDIVHALKGKAEVALLDSLLEDTVLMRDMLLAGGASGGMYGEAMSIYTELIKVSAVLSAAKSANLGPSSNPWDDRTQTKTAILRRLALGTAVGHAVPVTPLMKQLMTPPWGPASDPNATMIDPIGRYLHYEAAYVAGNNIKEEKEPTPLATRMCSRTLMDHAAVARHAATRHQRGPSVFSRRFHCMLC
jgi:hypothetical protein